MSISLSMPAAPWPFPQRRRSSPPLVIWPLPWHMSSWPTTMGKTPEHLIFGISIAAIYYRIELVEERAGNRLPYPPLGYTLAFDLNVETPRNYVNTTLLGRLAQATDGVINLPPGDPF